jgi:RND family efflux transporter MFP subunit
VVKPELRDMSHAVGQPGFAEAYEQTAIYAKVSGFIKKFYVDIGQEVKKGQVLCDLIVPELEEDYQQKTAQVAFDRKAVEQALGVVEVAKTNVETAFAEFAEAKANVGKYEAEVVRWQSEVKRLSQMVEEKVVDRQVLDETQKELDSSKSAREAAQAAVAARHAATLARQADLAKARIDVEVARCKVKVSEADARRVAALVAYTQVTAPYDSVVTVRNANTGDYILAISGDKLSSGQVPIFVVARTDLVRIFVDVPEAYARYVHAGTKALLRAEATCGIEIPATVARTSWRLNATTRALRAEIDLPVQPYGIRPGMYVYGKVIIERPQARVLPQDALVTAGDQTYCYLLEGSNAVRTPIQLGIRDGTRVEVLKKKVGDSWIALAGDEEVIVGDLSEIADGQHVEIAREES